MKRIFIIGPKDRLKHVSHFLRKTKLLKYHEHIIVPGEKGNCGVSGNIAQSSDVIILATEREQSKAIVDGIKGAKVARPLILHLVEDRGDIAEKHTEDGDIVHCSLPMNSRKKNSPMLFRGNNKYTKTVERIFIGKTVFTPNWNQFHIMFGFHREMNKKLDELDAMLQQNYDPFFYAGHRLFRVALKSYIRKE